MALSKHEEQVVAELEAQFQDDFAPPAPRRDLGKLALPLVCLLLGVAFLMAARDVGLVIRFSNLWGFSTSALTWTPAVTGHALLLGSAFLLGRGSGTR